MKGKGICAIIDVETVKFSDYDGCLGGQDIVTASPNFDMEVFVPQLREALTVMNARKRSFLISWIRVLSSVPDIDVLMYLADLLEGLTDALQENWPPEVRMSAGRCLQVTFRPCGLAEPVFESTYIHRCGLVKPVYVILIILYNSC